MDDWLKYGASVLFKANLSTPLDAAHKEYIYSLELFRRMARWMRKFASAPTETGWNPKFLKFVQAANVGMQLLDERFGDDEQGKKGFLSAFYTLNVGVKSDTTKKGDEGDFAYKLSDSFKSEYGYLAETFNTAIGQKKSLLPINGLLMMADVVGNLDSVKEKSPFANRVLGSIDENRKQLLLHLYGLRKTRDPMRSVLFYLPMAPTASDAPCLPTESGEGEAGSAAPPPPVTPPPIAPPTPSVGSSRSRAYLLTVHNLYPSSPTRSSLVTWWRVRLGTISEAACRRYENDPRRVANSSNTRGRTLTACASSTGHRGTSSTCASASTRPMCGSGTSSAAWMLPPRETNGTTSLPQGISTKEGSPASASTKASSRKLSASWVCRMQKSTT